MKPIYGPRVPHGYQPGSLKQAVYLVWDKSGYGAAKTLFEQFVEAGLLKQDTFEKWIWMFQQRPRI